MLVEPTPWGGAWSVTRDFTDYMSARWPALVRSAVLLGCTSHEAEDLVQTALTRCYVSWSKVASADDRDAYVYRVLVNCRTDGRRRQWLGERPFETVPEQDQGSDVEARVDVADAIERALGGISKALREVVVLRFYAHLTEEQTAAVLGIPRGTVKSRQSRALAELAGNEHLADLPDGNNP